MYISFIIAKNFFRDLVRRKILLMVVFFAFVFMSSALLLETLSLNQSDKMLLDLGIAGISFFSVIATLILANEILTEEVENNTIQFLLSKPIARWQILLGKFGGLASTLFVIILGMGIFWLSLMFLKTSEIPANAPFALLFLIFELLILASATILFSTFMSPMISLLCGVLFYLTGHLNHTVYELGQKNPSILVQKITSGFHFIIPDLNQLNLKNHLIYSLPLEKGEILAISFWAILWITLLLILSTIIFRKKEF